MHSRLLVEDAHHLVIVLMVKRLQDFIGGVFWPNGRARQIKVAHFQTVFVFRRTAFRAPSLSGPDVSSARGIVSAGVPIPT